MEKMICQGQDSNLRLQIPLQKAYLQVINSPRKSTEKHSYRGYSEDVLYHFRIISSALKSGALYRSATLTYKFITAKAN